ncbi:MAG: UDP-N-acetylmuramate dehydrogenase [Anaerolineae bacterium]|nr:UDP-N-acetylmuramate dehydrogenase [Anaerolineae bacterium]
MPDMSAVMEKIRAMFHDSLQENVVMANYTTARVGGKADGLLSVYSCQELEKAARLLWELEVPFILLGNGSNILVSDRGIRGIVLHNRAHNIKITAHGDTPTVWVESGATLSQLGQQVALRGLSGLEWASVIPGTVGGAVYGNAGAHGSDMRCNLIMAEILQPSGIKEVYSCEQMEYSHRSSILKRNATGAVILAAKMKLTYSTPQEVQALMESLIAKRRNSQPVGASMGSMFKNPPGEHAGKLIEAAGLKGTRVGGVEISTSHANFFINRGGGTASDYQQLIQMAQKAVWNKFKIRLELEIEPVGDWENTNWDASGD